MSTERAMPTEAEVRELVGRLRKRHIPGAATPRNDGYTFLYWCDACDDPYPCDEAKAATAIESLLAERDTALARLDKIAHLVRMYAEDDGEDEIVGKVREAVECHAETTEAMHTARREALEEAAKVCDAQVVSIGGRDALVAGMCAAAIRARLDEPRN